MDTVFLEILNMSLPASLLAGAIILCRFILKKAPKRLTVALWALVGIRLICPFSIESVLSLAPKVDVFDKNTLYYYTDKIEIGIPAVDTAINPLLSSVTPTPENSVNPMQVIVFIFSAVWVTGVALMLLYSLISCYRIHKKTREAAPLKDNIFICDRIDTPFIFGIIKPRIFIPSQMNPEDTEYVIAHEKAHLKRRDHWWKPLGFGLLSVYWFNPILWVGYILLCRDIELACDEKVIKEMGAEKKKAYSMALLNCSTGEKLISACPLAFGEVGVKKRVKSVLNYKKPAFWVVAATVVVSIVVAVCFMTNPKTSQEIYNSRFTTGECYYSYVIDKNKETKINNHFYGINQNGAAYKDFGDGNGVYIGIVTESDFTKRELFTLLKKQEGERFYIGRVHKAYELKDRSGKRSRVFLLLKNGGAVCVSFFSDGRIMDVFSLDRIITETEKEDDLTYKLDDRLKVLIDTSIASHNEKGDDRVVYSSVDWVTLGIDKKLNTTTVYMWVLYEGYNNLGEMETASHIPTVITAEKDGSDYRLTEYWLPGDGTQYKPDIQSKFPARLWDKALDSQRYIKMQQTRSSKQVAEYFSRRDENITSSDGYNKWGLKAEVTVESDTKLIMTLTHSGKKMNKGSKLSTSPVYEITAYHDNSWVSFGEYMREAFMYDYSEPVLAWDSVLFPIEENSENTYNIDLDLSYGKLPEGIYRISKEVFLENAEGKRERDFVYATFKIIN